MITDPDRLEALHALDILDTPPEREFDDIVQIASAVCAAPIALVSFVDRDRQWFKARTGTDLTQTPVSQSVCAHSLGTDELLVIADLTADPRTAANALVTREPRIRFYAGAPLRLRSGQSIGSLCVIDTEPRHGGLTQAQEKALRHLASLVMRLLDLRRGIDSQNTLLGHSEAAGAAYRTQAAHLRASQEAGRIATFGIEPETGAIHASPEFARLFGLPPASPHTVAGLDALALPGEPSFLPALSSPAAHIAREYRFIRADDGMPRTVLQRGEFSHDEAGQPSRFIGTVHDITARKRREARQAALLRLGDETRDAAETTAAVAAAARVVGETLGAARAGYAMIDLAGEGFHIEADWTAAGVASLAGRHALAAFAATLARLKTGETLAMPAIAEGGMPAADLRCYADLGVAAQIVVPVRKGRTLVGALFVHHAAPRRWRAGEIAFAKEVADRTYAAIAKLQAEQQQHLLNEELSHRMKNTLSMVQAIAAQTLRGAENREAVRAFSDRLMALSSAHEALLAQSWTSARMHQVIERVLALHAPAGRFTVHGPDISLGARSVLTLSMLMHELATNALKYGALATERGQVKVSWSLSGPGADVALVLAWEEIGAEGVAPPRRRGFGSRLIDLGLSGTGGASLHYKPTGLLGTFRAPLALLTAS